MLLIELFAEREGFEPPVPLSTAVFKTAVIDHSTISPKNSFLICECLKKSAAKLMHFWKYRKTLPFFLRTYVLLLDKQDFFGG